MVIVHSAGAIRDTHAVRRAEASYPGVAELIDSEEARPVLFQEFGD